MKSTKDKILQTLLRRPKITINELAGLAMEAAAAGLPIIATDIRGCRQVVDDGRTGILVPPRSAGAISAALEQLIGDPIRRTEMGALATEKAAREFDQQRVIETTLSTYERLLTAVGREVPVNG